MHKRKKLSERLKKYREEKRKRDSGIIEPKDLEPLLPAAEPPFPPAGRDLLDLPGIPHHAHALEDSGDLTVIAEENRNLRRLHEIMLSFGSETELDALQDLILELAMGVTHSERAILVLRQRAEGAEGEGPGELRAMKNFAREDLNKREFQWAWNLLGEILNTGRPLIVNDLHADPRFKEHGIEASLKALEIRSFVAYPLVAAKRILGAVYLDHPYREGTLGPKDRHFLHDFFSHAAMSLYRIMHMGALQRKIEDLAKKVAELRKEVARREKAIEKIKEKSLRKYLDLPFAEARIKVMQRYFKEALERNDGDLERAASEAGLGSKRLLALMKKFKMKIHRKKQ